MSWQEPTVMAPKGGAGAALRVVDAVHKQIPESIRGRLLIDITHDPYGLTGEVKFHDHQNRRLLAQHKIHVAEDYLIPDDIVARICLEVR
jgi:hypothetical protein